MHQSARNATQLILGGKAPLEPVCIWGYNFQVCQTPNANRVPTSDREAEPFWHKGELTWNDKQKCDFLGARVCPSLKWVS